MDKKTQNTEPAVREAYHGVSAPTAEARETVRRKLLLRFARKKETGE